MSRLRNPNRENQERRCRFSAARGRACSSPECGQQDEKAALPHCGGPCVLWQVSGYSLLVQAVDSGIPAMSSTATVNIDISDVNDNSPVFTPANYSAVIQVSTSGPDALSLLPLLWFTHRFVHFFFLFSYQLNLLRAWDEKSLTLP